MTLPLTSRLVWALGLAFAVALGEGCSKPAAQARADELASQVRAEPGCTQTLRQWFATTESSPPSEKAVPIPESLQSEWWRGAQAHAVWSIDGKLQRISVVRDGPWVPFIVIGRLGDTAGTLGLTQKAGEPPAFYAEITNGMYTCSPYYK
jgi:hypothetical protein